MAHFLQKQPKAGGRGTVSVNPNGTLIRKVRRREMFGQLLIALWMGVWGVLELLNVPNKKAQKYSSYIKSEKHLRTYRRMCGLIKATSAIFIACMAVAEKQGALRSSHFLLIYVIFAVLIIGCQVLLNFRYLKHRR